MLSCLISSVFQKLAKTKPEILYRVELCHTNPDSDSMCIYAICICKWEYNGGTHYWDLQPLNEISTETRVASDLLSYNRSYSWSYFTTWPTPGCLFKVPTSHSEPGLCAQTSQACGDWRGGASVNIDPAQILLRTLHLNILTEWQQ